MKTFFAHAVNPSWAAEESRLPARQAACSLFRLCNHATSHEPIAG
jgi:hypothetical protein